MRTARLAPFALTLLCLLAARAQAGAEEELRSLERATLERPETPVVVPGVRLERLLGALPEELRAYAFRDGALRPIPFQMDERTPEERYAFDRGEERRSDTDDGLDFNDEIVLMAADVGDRVATAAIRLGQSALEEVMVADPRSGRRGWVYLLRFLTAPPPPSPRRYVRLDWRDDGQLAGWSGDRVQVVGPPAEHNLFHLHQVRFARPQGGYGIDVLDRAKLSLKASYLFLDLERKADEIRAEVLGYTVGPIRAIASYLVETYLIWGHWIRSTRRCRLKVYGDRFELETELQLPVNLEPRRRSELRMSLDLSPSAGPVRIWSDTNSEPLAASGDRGAGARRIDRAFPSWVVASFPSGSILARLRLGNDLRRATNALFLADDRAPDPPEDLPGSFGNTGFVIDLSGLEAGTYHFTLTLQFGPPIAPGEEARLLRVDDVPLQAVVTREP